MHIAVDAHNLLTDRRGISVYLRAVVSRMLQNRGYRVTLLVHHMLPMLKKAAIAEQLGSAAFSIEAKVPAGADVVWHPWNGTFFLGGRRNVVTMHDAAPFAFPAAQKKKRASEQEPFLRSARIADRILTDSAFSKSEIEKYLQVEPRRLAVIPLGVDTEIFSPGRPQRLPAELDGRKYILYVGSDEQSKNLHTLIEAWRGAAAAQNIALAVVGTCSAPDVITLSNISSEGLRDLYRGALCFAFPSLYEGFGLPPLEAMACGTPVVTTRAASLPEVCGEAALYVTSGQNVHAWQQTLQTLIEDTTLQQDLSQRGRTRAAAFPWEKTARATESALEAAAA